MNFKDLNPSVVELASANVFYRVQLVRARSSNVVINGVSLSPVGLMSGRFCLSDEPVAYLADSQETALYESLLRRETVSRSLVELRRKCLVTFETASKLRLADLRRLAERYPVLQSLRFTQTQQFAKDCRSQGLDGIIYASAQQPHHDCTALFRSGIEQLRKLESQRLVKLGSDRLLAVLETALWRSGVPLVD